MPRKHLNLLFFLFTVSAMAFGQQSIDQQEPKVLLDNANYLMASKNYGGARAYFEQYIASNDTTYLTEAKYYNAICGLKLYHLDGEKLMNDFIEDYPTSPLSSKAYIDMGSYFFHDRNYKEAIVYLSKVDQTALFKDSKAKIQY
jgi:TolA-binding protein